MEHERIARWLAGHMIDYSARAIDLLIGYADMLHAANLKMNLTAMKSKEDIIDKLLLPSLSPLTAKIVPRGTSFVDLGTGQGIPGIPLGILRPDVAGLLIDSNSKKIEFISHVCSSLKLSNITPKNGRAEDLGRDRIYRERYDFLFSKAFATPYVALEMASPFVCINGHIYIYSNITENELSPEMVRHGLKLGLKLERDGNTAGSVFGGLLFKKISSVDPIYPRSYAIIKREGKRAEC